MKLSVFWGILLMCLVSVSNESYAKDVIIPYDDFIKLMAGVDHQKKSLKSLSTQNSILLQLKDEHGRVIALHKEQIEQCEQIVKDHEQLGTTQEQLVQELDNALKKEQRYRRYQTEGVVLVVLAGLILWVVN